MKIPEKFKVNTKDFKISFDNNKKTYVCESLDTGEKTNIGVLGILMQMGILKPIEDKATEERLLLLTERINNLEAKIDDLIKNVGSESKPEVKETPREEVKEKPKSKINEQIMKKVLEQSEEETDEENSDEEFEEEPEEDVEIESDEEIENWMKI